MMPENYIFNFLFQVLFLYIHRNFKINLQRMKQRITISFLKLVVGTILREKRIFTQANKIGEESHYYI